MVSDQPTARDRTGRDHLNVSAHELLEAVPDAIVGVDAAGAITFVNAQAERMFGYERREMVGRQVELLMPDRFHRRHVAHRASYRQRPQARPMGAGLDLLARRKDGSEFPVEVSLSSLDTPEGVEVVSVVRDVTQHREAERERQHLLDVAKDALRARIGVEHLKDDLTSMIVHDLKSPVNGIAMTVQLLLRRGALAEVQRDKLAQIERACGDLLRLIGHILDIAKIEAGQMPVTTEPIAIPDLVDEIAAEFAPEADASGCSLHVAGTPGLPQIAADRLLLKRVLANLVGNGLRHSGSPVVRIEAVADADGRGVTLRVVDNGRGISAADRAHLFDKFGTRHLTSSSGTGLGLAFCRLAVERMQGEIVLTSEPGRVTAFAVTLPAVSAPAQHGAGEAVLDEQGAGADDPPPARSRRETS